MKYDFLNSAGETLSGRLEMPSGKPRAFAVFAHCFTCSKGFNAPTTIAKALASTGVAVLRFDFTGLGNSDGDFSNTNFSSNVEDLKSASLSLERDYEAPQLLIGHSLGGAAVLKAATELTKVRAVATIGAPSDVSHVAHLFDSCLTTIVGQGQARVTLAGRDFTIKKQFIDDLNEQEILDGIKRFRKALLIMHSPLDKIVSIDHAGNIFRAAQHPKSFVSLNKADHLLMRRQDSEYAAKVLSAWLDPYIE